jgi:peptide methionine sulfoxide reductase msrA/msrB
VEYLIRHIDPTDSEGSFHDRGEAYAPVIYFKTNEEQEIATKIIATIDQQKVYAKPLAILVLPLEVFYPAEAYHQDYAAKNPVRYKFYRAGSGRDNFIQKHWPDDTVPYVTPVQGEDQVVGFSPESYVKPNDETLKATLTPLQYKVTQQAGTERAFSDPLSANNAEGIYVDVVSGEPLFSSLDKYDSGTGWPSFVKPLTPSSVVETEDRHLFITRTEVSSRLANSHLGHVFSDGPADRGGLRYCLNGAALRFVAKDKLLEEGYGEYLNLFQ